MEKAGQGISPSVPRTLQPGDAAPDFVLPAVNRDGLVSLADYRGRCGVLVGLFRGFECPFCRRQITQIGVALEKLRASGVETLGIIATSAPRAALYLRYRPTPVLLLADPDLATHRAFGLPQAEVVLGRPGSTLAAVSGGGGADAAAEAVVARGNQLVGHFLIDRAGIIRWVHVEGAERARGASHFPSERELLEAARSLAA